MTKNITQLPAAGPFDGTEVFPAIQGGVDVKGLLSALLALARARASHTGTQSMSTVDGLSAALVAKADDSAVVKLTGNQTVAGIKTLSSSPVVPDGSWTIAKTTGLQAALDAKAPVTQGVNTQAASYTLALTDAGKVVEMNVAGANTLTVPLNATVSFPIGTVIDVFQMGAGQTTITPDGALTLINYGSKFKLAGQGASARLRKRATNEWVVSGDVVA